MIVSRTSSYAEIGRLMGILDNIKKLHEEECNLIIGGDFNFDFNNIESELKNLNKELKKSDFDRVKNNRKTLYKNLEEKYNYIKNNFIFYPSPGEFTNVWSLEGKKEKRKKEKGKKEKGKKKKKKPTIKCVDYIIVSKAFRRIYRF